MNDEFSIEIIDINNFILHMVFIKINGSKNVRVYVNPVIYYDFAIDEIIKIMEGLRLTNPHSQNNHLLKIFNRELMLSLKDYYKVLDGIIENMKYWKTNEKKGKF